MTKKRRRAPVSSDKRFKRVVPDSGPVQRWQHSGRVFEPTENAGIVVARATEEHVLDRLHVLGILNAQCREAGLKWQQDYVLARMEDRVTASYASTRGGGMDPETRLLRSDAQEAAYKRWRAALMALSLAERDVALHVACIGFAPALNHLARLKTALQKLASHYGLAK